MQMLRQIYLDKTSQQWSEITKDLYGDVDLTIFLSNTNMHVGYEKGWDVDEKINEYQLTVPFLKGDIIINCLIEDGNLVVLKIEL